ncbi:MAG: hypothetical protein KDC80_19955 [Saprospiraceae bacterium]|nr:hypothetical protein [Saprospiraceae bacterium]
MKNKRYIAFVFLVFGFIVQIKAQEAICHFDRPFYFPGQFLHYAFYAHLPKDSCILNVQLLQEEREVDQHYQEIRNGYANGYFALPFDIPNGDYFVRMTVFSDKDATPFNLMTTPVTILPDNDPKQEGIRLAVDRTVTLDPSINIDIDDAFEKRQTKTCTITVPNGMAGQMISIAVRDKDLYPIGQSIREQSFSTIDRDLSNYIPLIGSRRITGKKANPKAFLFSCNPEQLNFRFNWVESSGDFIINMTPFYGDQEIYFIDNGGNEIEVSIRDKQDLPTPAIDYVSDNSFNEIIEANNERKKIYQLFSRVEENVLKDSAGYFEEILKPDMDIDVQDYAIRGKLVDLLKEVITPFKFRKINEDEYRVKVLYEVLDLKYFYDSDPIFIINGMVTRDFSFIANLPLQDIKRLKIYAKLETIRDLKLVDIGGVGVLEMVDPLFSISDEQRLPHTLVQGIQMPAKYPISVDTGSEIPQLKSLLFWMPDAILDAKGQFTFMLPASDDISNFEIEVVHPQSRSTGRREIEIKL